MFTSSTRGLRLAGASAVALIAVAVGATLFFSGAFSAAAEPHVFASVVYDPVEAVPDFTLTSHDGQPFTLSEFDGDVVAIYFGYTHCPDVCPLTLSNLARAKEMLPEDVRDDLEVVMLSVDPERDTVAALADYVPHFDSEFLGVSGAPRDVQSVLKDWRIRVELGEPDDDGNYLVGHPAFTLVLDRDGQRRLKMNHFLTVDQMAADLRAVLEES